MNMGLGATLVCRGAVALALIWLGALAVTASASAVEPCAKKKVFTSARPVPRGIWCRMPQEPRPGESAEMEWTVPPRVGAAQFGAYGAGLSGVEGGTVVAAFPVTPGETLTLRFGVGGSATSVMRGDVALLVAAGASGMEQNFVTPGAREVMMKPTEPTGGLLPRNGSIFVNWQTGRRAAGWTLGECVVPGLRGESPAEAREMLDRSKCGVGPSAVCMRGPSTEAG